MAAADSSLPVQPRIQEFLQRPEFQHLFQAIAISAAIAQVVRIFAYWVGAKAVAERDRATVANAFLLWLFYLIFAVLLAVGVGILMPVVVELGRHDQVRVLIIVGGTALMTFLLIFLIPMKLYVIGFLRALLLLMIALGVSILTMGVVGAVVFKVLGADKDVAALVTKFSGPEGQKFAKRLAGQEAPDEIDRLLDDALDPIGPPPSLKDREAQVRTLQQKLQARKGTFPPGTPPDHFQDQLKRYLVLLDQAKAERSVPAQLPITPAATPTPAARH